MSERDRKINEVMNFGAPRETARRALEMSNWDVNRATNAYLDGLVTNINILVDETMNRLGVGQNQQQRTIPIQIGNLGGNLNFRNFQLNNIVPLRPRGSFLQFVNPAFTEEDKEKLSLNLTPEEHERKLTVRRINETPKLLPAPSNELEYSERFLQFEMSKEERKDWFLRKSAKAFHTAREMYYDAVRLIFFLVMSPYREIREKLSNENFTYSVAMHSANMKKIMIGVRKIAECSYYLGLYKESMNICRTNIAICDIFQEFRNQEATVQYNCRKMLKLTFGVMGRIMTVKGNLKRSKKFIDSGLELDPGSGILQKSRDDLLCLLRGKDFMHDRFKVLAASKELTFQTYSIRFPIGEMEYMEDSIEDDEYFEERVTYLMNEEVMKKQDLDRLLVTCVVKDHSGSKFSVLLWKSLI